MNSFTLVSAVAIAQSGKIFDGSNAFLDADGNTIPSGKVETLKYLGSAIVNARYVGQLITDDQLTNPTSQPDFLFAVYNARHEVVFMNIQTFSQVRDGNAFSQLKKKDPDGITVADMNFIWATEPYDPRQTIGTHGEPYESITTLTSVLGLSQDQFYNIAVDTVSYTEPKWDGSDPLHQKFAQGISFYNSGPVSDSNPASVQTVAALENRPYTGAIALLTLREIQALLRLSTVPSTQTTIAPAAIERGD